jgi:nicotinamidase-related amidase
MKRYVNDPLKVILAPMGDVELSTKNTALLVVDMQYLDASPDHGIVVAAREESIDTSYYVNRLELITKNIKVLLEECRSIGLEVMYCTIESMTKNGRDRSLQHKNANLHAAPGSKDAMIIEEIKPLDDEIVFKKTSSGVFNSTTINQVLRNMKIENLIIVGVVTNQCIDTAVRDASDCGFEVVLVEDCCGAFDESLHQASVEILGGVYCRVKSLEETLKNIKENN